MLIGMYCLKQVILNVVENTGCNTFETAGKRGMVGNFQCVTVFLITFLVTTVARFQFRRIFST